MEEYEADPILPAESEDILAVAGSASGRASRATDADSSSDLGNIDEDEEEEEDFIELPAVTKPPEPVLNEAAREYLQEKKQEPVKECVKEKGTRQRSNSLFRLLGRRQKLVEEAEKRLESDNTLVEGSEPSESSEVEREAWHLVTQSP